MESIVGFIVIFGLGVIIFLSHYQQRVDREKRVRYLMGKYNDSLVVDRIIKNQVWINQTKDQLIDSRGNPQDIDQKVMKTKIRETYKYGRMGNSNNYRFRVIIDDNIVTGWDDKS